ncbi:hypothetical protein OAK45_04880 [Verrucomicrobia bacterium]|nr:hypothetical protein [Verrucomicrobiota bacterium]
MKQILLMIAVVALTGAVVTLAGCAGNKSSSKAKPVDVNWSYPLEILEGLGKGMKK